MKKIFPLAVVIFLLAGCVTFEVAPQPVLPWTAAPSNTPNIITATPVILTSTFAQTLVPSLTVAPPATQTNTLPPPTGTSTTAPTSTPAQSVAVDILGCNTGLDLTHGMGEVTNAYVTVKNTGTIDLPNTCALLRAKDEGREHPDKKVCIPNLPVGKQVTLKLTVDSTYKQDTVIQADATSNDVILLRVDKPSCADISVFGGAPSDVGVVKPMQ